MSQRLPLASASKDETVRLWDVDAGEQFGAPVQGHDADVGSVAWLPDRSRLASASRDKTVRLWDVEAGEPVG